MRVKIEKVEYDLIQFENIYKFSAKMTGATNTYRKYKCANHRPNDNDMDEIMGYGLTHTSFMSPLIAIYKLHVRFDGI